MPTLLDELWYSYQMEKASHNTAEEQAVLHRVVHAESVLLGELNAERKACLDAFLSLQGELHSLYEKKAFRCGVRFAVQFLSEAILSDSADRS